MNTDILMFHGVGDSRTHSNISQQELDRKIGLLKQTDSPILPLKESIEFDGHSYSVTFDDAYENFLYQAIPVIEKHSIPVTLFAPTELVLSQDFEVISNRFGEHSGKLLLDEDELYQVSKNNLVNIGNHTNTHPNLLELTLEEAKIEINKSLDKLERIIGTPIHTFSYPYAEYSEEIVNIVRENHEYAVINQNTPNSESQYKIPRHRGENDISHLL